MNLPGRLGNPKLTFQDDPRADPRIARVMALLASDGPLEPPAAAASYEQCLSYCAALEKAGALVHPQLWQLMPKFDDVDSTIESIKGVDGNDITLFIERQRTRQVHYLAWFTCTVAAWF